MAACNDDSAWSRYRRPRTATGRIGLPREHPKLSVCYRHPAELSVDCCPVAESTGHAWETDRVEPSGPRAKRFWLHRDRLAAVT